MPARDALHFQMILADDLKKGGVMGGMLDEFERSQRGMPMRSTSTPDTEAVANPIGMFSPRVPYDPSSDGLRQKMERGILMSLPFYIDPRMNALVTAAAESLPVDTVLRPENLPATHGFLLIPDGISEVDLRGQLMVHNAIAWFQRAGGVDVWFLSNKNDERDMLNIKHHRIFGDEMVRMFPTIMPAVYGRIEFGESVPFSIGGTKVLPPEVTAELTVIKDPKTGSYAWAWPQGYDMDEWIANSIEVGPNPSMIWLMAVWLLMQQTIVDVRTEPVDRPLRKAAIKRKMKQSEVSVIALRKRKAASIEGESQIEWSHRWLVRGHWRQQWVGPRDGEMGVERYQTPIWIHPHIKGPDNAPLLVRDHVYSLER
jgi:hypothetical protein